ncbi:hypothetical protein [Natronorarus salvus]|uniref:hypothetical protein n=1 Tax=Natronorarus salvus TaxID=3117733 RepID=UPI002F266457
MTFDEEETGEGSEKDLTTEDTMRERAEENRFTLWVLLNANRWALTAALGLGVFTAFVLWGSLRPPSIRVVMETTDWVEMSFQALIGALITGTTLVVTINQLVLSQEIGPLGDQRERMDRAMDFYQNTDKLLEFPSPSHPGPFMRDIIETTEKRAKRFEETVSANENEELRSQVREYVEDLSENAQKTIEGLNGTEFGDYDMIGHVLNYNYNRKLYDLRWILLEYEDELSEEEREAGKEALTAIAMYGPAREYVKTLYFQWSLVKLSQGILYLAIPALAISGAMVMLVDANTFTDSILGVDTLLWVVSGAYTVAILPFLLFATYILRLATIAKRTLTVGPLVLRGG